MPIMSMTSRLRKLALTTHVSVSVGWLGAVAAYLALAITGLTTRDGEMASAAYRCMEVIGWVIIVPCSFAALLSGLLQSVGTEWGLFRHYWIVAKLSLTVPATAVLLLHVPSVSRMARLAVDTAVAAGDFAELRMQLVVHAAGGLLVLLTITALSVYKPWGRIGGAGVLGTGRMRAR
jgi:hypothetical protein